MRKAFIIIIILVVVMTLAALAVMFFNGRNPSNTNEPDTNTVVPIDSNTNSTQVVPIDNSEQLTAISQARSFGERYGSWAPASLDAYYEELTPWLTESFAAKIRTMHESAEGSSTLLSIASQSLSSSVKEWEVGTRATIEVVLNRTEQRKNDPAIQYYETLTLSLVFQNEKWLIDNAQWEPSRVQPGGSGG